MSVKSISGLPGILAAIAGMQGALLKGCGHPDCEACHPKDAGANAAPKDTSYEKATFQAHLEIDRYVLGHMKTYLRNQLDVNTNNEVANVVVSEFVQLVNQQRLDATRDLIKDIEEDMARAQAGLNALADKGTPVSDSSADALRQAPRAQAA